MKCAGAVLLLSFRAASTTACESLGGGLNIVNRRGGLGPSLPRTGRSRRNDAAQFGAN